MSIKTLIQRQQVNYIVRSFSAQERVFMGLPKNYIGINPGYWAKGEEVKKYIHRIRPLQANCIF